MILGEEKMSKMVEYLQSEEGQKDLQEWFQKQDNEEKILEEQLIRFHTKFGNNLTFIIEKIKTKYNSDKYQDRWYNRSIEPEETLYWFLFKYAKKYGEEITDNSPQELLDKLNMFTSAAYKIDNFVIHQMNGQGSVIHIEKIK